MSTSHDPDLTVPSVAAALAEGERESSLLLTIIFHPDPSRIGESARIPKLEDEASWIVGRRSPAFSRLTESHSKPLEERHVSRQALSVSRQGMGLVLRRLPDSSRARVAGRELRDSVELSRDQLRQGVRVLLGHSVVLLLREAPASGVSLASAAGKNLCGSSPYMAALRALIARLAAAGPDVLIRGETGTGKELVAAALHAAGSRCDRPMVSINMAAIPPGLAAATLFGSARGSFTGANRASEGFFSRADGGTIFLDEIGDTPAEIQPQLLRALQEREIQSVGGAIRTVDLRVISATDGLLEGETCGFKAALRHRLGAGEIHLLPLTEHPEDIGELLLHFLNMKYSQFGGSMLLPNSESPAGAVAAWAELFHSFLGYHWPGNVRELANFASQVVVASFEELTLPEAVRLALRQSEARDPATPGGDLDPPRRTINGRKIREIDAQEFDAALRAASYEVANAARQLGVSRQAVYRRMDESPDYRLAGQVPGPEIERALALRAGDSQAAALDLKVSASGLRARLRDSALEWF